MRARALLDALLRSVHHERGAAAALLADAFAGPHASELREALPPLLRGESLRDRYAVEELLEAHATAIAPPPAPAARAPEGAIHGGAVKWVSTPDGARVVRAYPLARDRLLAAAAHQRSSEGDLDVLRVVRSRDGWSLAAAAYVIAVLKRATLTHEASRTGDAYQHVDFAQRGREATATLTLDPVIDAYVLSLFAVSRDELDAIERVVVPPLDPVAIDALVDRVEASYPSAPRWLTLLGFVVPDETARAAALFTRAMADARVDVRAEALVGAGPLGWSSMRAPFEARLAIETDDGVRRMLDAALRVLARPADWTASYTEMRDEDRVAGTPVERGWLVEIAFTASHEGETVDEATMTMQQGSEDHVAGLSDALLGLAVGDAFDVELEPERAFGVKTDETSMMLRSELAPGVPCDPGDSFSVEESDGSMRLAYVLASFDDRIHVTSDHPLAGMTLRYRGRILAARDPFAPRG